MLLRRPARRLRTVPSSSVPSMSSRMPPSTAGSTFVLRSMCLPVTFSSFSCRRPVCSAVSQGNGSGNSSRFQNAVGLIVAQTVGPGTARQLPQSALFAQQLHKVEHIEVDLPAEGFVQQRTALFLGDAGDAEQMQIFERPRSAEPSRLPVRPECARPALPPRPGRTGFRRTSLQSRS